MSTDEYLTTLGGLNERHLALLRDGTISGPIALAMRARLDEGIRREAARRRADRVRASRLAGETTRQRAREAMTQVAAARQREGAIPA